MRITIRRTALAGVATVMAVGLMVPASAAFASPGHGHAAHKHGGNSSHANDPAKKALREAIKAANTSYRNAVHAARDAFKSDPVVINAKAARDAIVKTSGDPAAIDAAKLAFASAIIAPLATRDAAISAAAGVWQQSVDAAFANFDLATNPADAAALGTLRTAIHNANAQSRTDKTAAEKAYRSAISHAASVRRAAVNTAIAAWNASAKDSAAADAFHMAVVAAKTAFDADQTVIDAKTARSAAVAAAKTARTTAIAAARAAFLATTGHEAPKHLGQHTPRV
ncbi:MAG: hypothetical protein WCP81_08120 [Actinomycetes bacterium]